MDLVEFTIHYDNKEIACTAHLYRYGYTFRVEVQVQDEVIIFEPDEEGLFRAIMIDEASNTVITIPSDLLKTISVLLQEALA